jgi:glutamate synthase domain-containing protein 1
MMVVPEAWEKRKPCLMIKSILRIQFLYYGTMGRTASIPFTDEYCGALLDRNGLRPSTIYTY